DFLQLPAPHSFEGASLLPAARAGKDDGRAEYSESMYARDAFHWAPLRGIRVGAFQYIDAPKPELYDVQTDPAETHNLVTADPQGARTWRGRLANLESRRVAAHAASSGAASQQTRNALESLGYLGRSPGSGGSNLDPKDRLPEYNLYEK